jgi:translocation and assembly module TamA
LSAEKILDNRLLYGQLGIVVAMLQITTSALTVIFAGWYYSARMFFKDLLYFPKKIVFFNFFRGYYYTLIRQYVPDKNYLPGGKAGKTVTSVNYLRYVYRFGFHLSIAGGHGTVFMRLKQAQRMRPFNPEILPFHNLPSLACRILFFFSAFLLLIPMYSTTGFASVKIDVAVKGVSGPLYKNVMARLTIDLQKNNERLQPNIVKRLHRQADDDIRSALAPFGYYNPVIKSTLEEKGEVFHVEYTIDKGPPVIVKDVVVELSGGGKNNKQLLKAISGFPVKAGDILNQDSYEQGKKKLVNEAISEGFLDAAFTERAIRINREANTADVQLVLNSGRQYLFGETTSDQQILEQDLLDRYLPYKKGDPFSQAKLFELQSILYRTDYFSRVVVQGQTSEAEDFRIPVEIDLTAPEHLNKYRVGAGYATDTGIKGKVDWSNRLFNSWGHKISAGLQLAELENIVSMRYEIPRNDPRYNKLVHSLGYQDKKWEDTNTELLTAGVAHEYSGPRLNLSGGLELRDEVYDVGDTSGTSTLLVPSLKAGRVWADDVLFTKNGLQVSVGFLGSVDGLVSDTSFLQATVNGKTIISPIKDWRVIGRGTLGATLVDSIDSLPPSLRFYT